MGNGKSLGGQARDVGSSRLRVRRGYRRLQSYAGLGSQQGPRQEPSGQGQDHVGAMSRHGEV